VCVNNNGMHSVFSKSWFMYMYGATKCCSEGVPIYNHSNNFDPTWKLVVLMISQQLYVNYF